ncbi:disintegrin and metalloproteinase domain-containing protein 10 isoform X1 [Cloeon dipterum]|uniref:disintegrin and metalloproteinase domain-containing protein 10 isoform X1 n=1 Tax=Cloeon dipterum TaxID=197152 RepID=UPI00321FCB5A
MVQCLPPSTLLSALWAALLLLLTFSVTADTEIPVENAFIKRFEPALYDRTHLLRQHARVRRSAASTAAAPHALRLDVAAFNRTYKLRLFPDVSVFSNDVTFEGTRGPVSFDLDRAYEGTLDDDESVEVKGLVTSEGLFDGSLTWPNGESIYVEPTSRYVQLWSDDVPHSVVYRSGDVRDPELPACASQELHDRLQGTPSAPAAATNVTAASRRKRWLHGARRKRAAAIDPHKTTCMLYLQADHLFFQKFGSEEACIEVMTRHVQRVNSIYQGTDFDQDGKTDRISFMIKRIKVHSADALNDTSYRFPGNYGVEKFLELFSEEDYDAFCLAYMFTYRDFEMGTLGLAWTGDLKNAGGVCEKNGHYRGSMKSLNTGIVTLLNYGKHVPPAVSHVTLAHEIGHNFGSPHDPENCTPGGEDGNYIMFARATSGDKRNNNKFSPCSLDSISPVLAAKARSSRGCFTEPQTAICGNGVVEPGEECDCGWESDCRDSCCFPMSSNPRPNEPPCRLTPRSSCSPSQGKKNEGPCCTSECNLKFGDKCRDDNGCRDASYCDGRGPACPPSTNKPNKTVCNEEFVCFMGECTGSICLAYGLESCQCIPGPRDPPTKACELCCKSPGDDQPCLSSFDWNLPPFDIPDLYSKPGTPCNNYIGYCDVFQKCREVDPSGPLATLRKLLLSDENLATAKKWIGQNWYFIVLTVVVVISLMVMVAKAFGRRDDSKLRAVTILHTGNATEQVRLPPGGGLTVHPGVRSKLPLGKRVRAKVNKKTGSPNGSPEKQQKQRRRRRKEDAGGEKVAPKVVVAADPVTGTAAADDPLGKVRNWLISSNPAPSAPQKVNKHMPKSKSTPAALACPAPPPAAAPATRAAPAPRVSKARNKSHSLGNLQAKSAKLQLLYKPPFKLTVKLKKREDGRAAAAAVARGRTALLIRGGRGGGGADKGRAEAKKQAAHRGAADDLDVTTVVPSDRAVLINSGPVVT